MFKWYYQFFLMVLGLICGSVQAVEPVFKGAIGFGVTTPAGSGGQIIKVTNLNAAGPGSFVEALMTKGPRIIVFEVGGIIDLNLATVRIVEPYLTVAGQTAPSPGITLIRGGMQVRTHDVLIQHIRIRTGDADSVRVPWEIDALSTVGGEAYNIVIDHCSFSWGTDECLSASGLRKGPESTSHQITFSNNIIAETLHHSIHPKRVGHSRATVINDFCQNVAVIRNIYAHNDMRHPNFKPASTGVIINNLVYDPGSRGIHTHGSEEEIGHPIDPPQWAIVGNRLICGPSTGRERLPGYRFEAFIQSELDISVGPAKLFIKDNDSNGMPMTTGPIIELTSAPVWPDVMAVLPVSQVYDELTVHAGARPVDRDAVDSRIIKEIKTRTGHIIDSQNEVGGYPKAEMTHHTLEIPPSDQVPAWLEELARKVEGR